MAGKIYVVGLGPGGAEDMTLRAVKTLEKCEVIAGYTTYIDLIKEQFADKEFVVTGMKKEVERCRAAVDEARRGKIVAMVSSGDAGVYGMAGIMHEVAEPYDDIKIEVIPGITAACSGAARLGAPLISDFCLISLSDLMTPWKTIAKRLELAAAADFVICLYNPGSKGRPGYLEKACRVIGRHLPPQTPAGIIRNIGRDGETAVITTLAELEKTEADMFTTVIIGNSRTKVIKGHMVTPRGYTL